MESFSLTDIKKKNLSDVYHHIYANPGCSKQAIANALTMSLPTVTQHLTTLLNGQFIEKCGQLTSTVGRRAMAYQILPTARIAVGIEILSHCIYIVALNLYGKKETKEKYILQFHSDETYFEELKDLVNEFLKKHGYDQNQLLGIGLGVQGLTSPDGTQITYGLILNCTGLSIDRFAEHFSVPCRFIHDAECASNSELWENPDIQDAIFLSLGYHLGGAIIIHGNLQRGVTGKAGTFEHMTLIPDGLDCYCGRKGCAECYCSGNSLLEGDQTLEEFFEEKSNGAPGCQEKWNHYLQYLAMLVNNLHMVLETTVVLGGHVTPYITEQDMNRIKEMVLERSTFPKDDAFLLQGKCRSDAVSIGAALPFVKQFLDEIGGILK